MSRPFSVNRSVRLKLREVRLLIRINTLRYHRFPLAEAPLELFTGLLQATHQHGRIVLARRGDVPVA
jgi:hypothetical protein